MPLSLRFEGPPRSPTAAHLRALFPFEHCECLSARLIVERWREHPRLTGLVLPLTLSRPVKGLLFRLSLSRGCFMRTRLSGATSD